MKKITPMLLVLSMLVAGCGGNTASVTENTTIPTQTTQATTEPTEEAVILQEDMSAVSVPATVEITTTADGSEIFRYTGQSMNLVVPDTDVADKIIIDFLTRQDKHKEASEDIKVTADKNTSGTSYFYNVLYNPTRIDHNVMSLSGTIVTWSGGSHPNYNCIYANYNMVTGDVLTLGSILTHEDKSDDLAELLIEAITLVQEEQGIWDGFEKSIRNRFAKNISYDESWFFDSQGLSFSFPPYEVAPYSYGVITVTVPYEKLVGIIEDEFFPLERDTATGNLEATLLSDTNMSDFNQIGEIVLDAEGSMILLYTDKAVYDVTIQVESENYTAFATAALTPGDAVMLQADITAHPLIVNYRTGNDIQSRYISVKDGNVQLLEEIPE